LFPLFALGINNTIGTNAEFPDGLVDTGGKFATAIVDTSGAP
jgi:hypothetical protein